MILKLSEISPYFAKRCEILAKYCIDLIEAPTSSS
jgi:hypothetical protein